MSKITLENVISMSKQVEDLKSDHVSKKALREWCKEKIKAVEHDIAIGLDKNECLTYILAIKRVLIDFCEDR